MALASDEVLYSPLVEKTYVTRSHDDDPSLSPDPRRRWRNLDFTSKFFLGLVLANFLAFSMLVPLTLKQHANVQCGRATDSLFGDIPWHDIVLENDEEFVNSDPAWGPNDTVWNSIYPSAWVAVSDPTAVGFDGGVKMSEYAEDPSLWESGSQAFGVAVMHQIHCVVRKYGHAPLIKDELTEFAQIMLKHAVLQYRDGFPISTTDEHLDHCIEYLRQAVMCHGDLTLELPEGQDYPHRDSGWGNVHRCRDWDSLISSVRRLAIERGPTGWLKLT